MKMLDTPAQLVNAGTVEEIIPYDKFFSLTNEGFHRYGNIFELPVCVGPRGYMARTYRKEYLGGEVLDFGCGTNRALQEDLGIGDDLYFACDTDPSARVNFRSLAEIPADMRFQMINSDQVLEHLSFGDCIQAVIGLAAVVATGGVLVLGVPNPQHPTRYLCNPTHVTPLTYLNLYALLRLAGLEVVVCARCNKQPGPRWYERPFVGMMSRVFRMDWCDTIYAVGRKVK